MNFVWVIIFVVFFSSSSLGQIYKYYSIKELSDKSISLVVGQDYYTDDDSVGFRKVKRFASIILVFNKTKDSIELYNCEYKNGLLDSFDIKSVYFGKNSAILITLRLSENTHFGESGGYLMKKTIQEIWDVKSKKRIFTALNDYYYKADFSSYLLGINIPPDSADWSSHDSETICSYHYNFFINDKSQIVISELTTKLIITEYSYLTGFSNGNTKFPHYSECLKPDNEMGIYEFVNGKFIKIER